MNHITKLRKKYADYEPKELDLAYKPELQAGWNFKYLYMVDCAIWKRWDYWNRLATYGELPEEEIPQIRFEETPNRAALKMLERCFTAITSSPWCGWSTPDYLNYFLDWLIWSIDPLKGGQKPEVKGGMKGDACEMLYQAFDLWPILLYPHDYFGHILSECSYGKSSSFFPTPHAVAETMVKTNMGENVNGKDNRLATVYDPCVGTGRMLLHASNYSLCLYGQEINYLIHKACLVNMYLYAPWGARPLNHLVTPVDTDDDETFIIDWSEPPDKGYSINWDID
jgi:hypothetical protein